MRVFALWPVVCILKLFNLIHIGWLYVFFWPIISWKFFLLFVLIGGISITFRKEKE